MSIWGKIMGGVSGFALGSTVGGIGGPIGALIGAWLGHVALDDDRWGAEEKTPQTSLTFTAAVIALAAKMAKADGFVTADEVRTFQKLFVVNEDEVENLQKIFDIARESTAGFEDYAGQVAGLFGQRAAILEDILDSLFHIARADGRLHALEDGYLIRVAEIFGFTPADYERIRASHLDAAGRNPYAVLGVADGAPMADVKSAYRQLVKENHPDALLARGVPSEFLSTAQAKLQAINAAYAAIEAREQGRA